LTKKQKKAPLTKEESEVLSKQSVLTQEQIIEKLKEVHIHFATPCYGGVVTEPCLSSYIRFTIMALKQWLTKVLYLEHEITLLLNS